MRRASLLLFFFLLLPWAEVWSGCAGRRAAAPSPAARADSLEHLRADLDRIFSDPNFASAQWGVEILSLDRGDVLYERNPMRLYMPASNNKLLTTTAALVRLGPDFRYETRIMSDGPVEDGVLKGDLVIVGSGDPTISARFQDGDPCAIFRKWASVLKGKGIRSIEGDIVGDDRAFEETILGAGWEWDDLAYGYAAPVNALEFDENAATVEITPAEKEGDPAAVRAPPPGDLLRIDAQVGTGAAGADRDLEIRTGGDGIIVLRGTVPADTPPVTQTVAVQVPTRYFLRSLKRVLGEEGIDVSRSALRSYRDPGFRQPETLDLLYTHQSPTLAEIVKPLLKVSQNLLAETLARTLGSVIEHEGSFEAGRRVVEETLGRMGVEPGTYRYVDGSGLSRLNLVSADSVVRILKYMSRWKDFGCFYDALPIAGVDGTIETRMKGTRAENNVHAKTGSISNVRSLSGYVRTAGGETMAFSMIANNFLVSSRAAGFVQDAALERISNFSR